MLFIYVTDKLDNILLTLYYRGGTVIKNLLIMQKVQKTWVRSLVGKIHWRKKWQPTPVFFPGKSCGQRNLVGYSPQGWKELDTTE